MGVNKIELVISRKPADRVRKLRKRMGTDNNAEVFSYALALFIWAITEANQGRKIGSIDPKNHTIRHIDINGIFEKIRKQAYIVK